MYGHRGAETRRGLTFIDLRAFLVEVLIIRICSL